MSLRTQHLLHVGIAGLGAIGMPVARWLDSSANNHNLKLVAVSAQNIRVAEEKVASFNKVPPVVDLNHLVEASDTIVEALPPEYFEELAEPAIEQGKTLIILTLTSLMKRLDLIDKAKETGASLIAASGALVGFDGIRAASKGTVDSVLMKTRKPPEGLKKAPLVLEKGIDMDCLTEPLLLYKGTVRDAAAKFPANVNVAVSLALAGIGLDDTEYEIWADPGVRRNLHNITVEADAVSLNLDIANIPSEENPATGKLTPLSVIATLERLVAPFTVGT